MALVMLPSDFPSWTTVEKKLQAIQKSEDARTVLECMREIHDLCNISLDPDDDLKDHTFLKGLEKILKSNDTSQDKAAELLEVIRTIAKRALTIKSLRPPRGLSFSLQQETNCIELDRCFVAALLANAFFSTFPKRTKKTHPTLQDFNFTNFFRSLDSNSQKAKFLCLMKYFTWLNQQENLTGVIKFSRKVMPGKYWLTIEDWIECTFPLCPVDVKHQGQIGNCFSEAAQAVFSSSHIGGKALQSGKSQECFQLLNCPEGLASLLFVEALEDNEAFLIEDVNQFSMVMDTKNKAIVEMLPEVRKVSLCCFDAENYRILPINQFEEDNVLRELNKCLLAFRQNSNCKIVETREKKVRKRPTRLSPIGESGSSSPNDSSLKIIVQQPTPANRSLTDLSRDIKGSKDRKQWLAPNTQSSGPVLSSSAGVERRGRFIVLGSSGEHLPVNREGFVNRMQTSFYSSCDSSDDDDDEFHSARQSLEDSDEESNPQIDDQDSFEKRKLFVNKLKEAFKQASNYTESTASSYAVGISLSGSRDEEEIIRLKRGGSTGFVLPEDSFDAEFRRNVLEQDIQWPDIFGKKLSSQKKDSNDSSNYSFSTDCSSELEEVLQKFSKWLCDPEIKEKNDETNPRNQALVNFANSLLKRTLSESFLGVPLTDGCSATTADALIQEYKDKKSRPVLGIKSLSLELAKFKNCLTTRSTGNRNVPHTRNLRPVATGNWGCGSSQLGFVQFKFVIQWMAASVAGLPVLIYYTNGHSDLTKLDTVVRVLRDRKWTVGELASAALKFAKENVEKTEQFRADTRDFFEKLLGL